MADDILQRFLAKRLFDVGGDDNRLEMLRSAAEELGGNLKASPQRIPAFTMVAIDPQVPADEPILIEVGEILQKHWNSYVGAFSDSVLPVVFRGIILTALEQIKGSEALATAIILTCRNLLPHLGAKKDSELWKSLIDASSRKLELRARREWALPSSAPLQEVELELPSLGNVSTTTANRDWLTKQLRAAVGPTDRDGEATDGNPHWPNSAEPWAHDFAERAASGIAGSINGVSKRLVESINTEAGLGAQATAIRDFIGEIAAGVAQTSLGLERRTSLIWWKEALYSPSAERSYREFSLPTASALMAIDAAEQTGPFAPRMAEALLLETIRLLDPVNTNTEALLTELCSQSVCRNEEGSDVVLKRLAQMHCEPGRTPLAGLIGTGMPIDGDVLTKRIGVAADTAMSPAEFAVWVFRDLQASAATPLKRKKRGK